MFGAMMRSRYFLWVATLLAGQRTLIVRHHPGARLWLALRLAVVPALLTAALLVVLWTIVLAHVGR
jgi:hypothetical protein